jgi:hypothetical protein
MSSVYLSKELYGMSCQTVSERGEKMQWWFYLACAIRLEIAGTTSIVSNSNIHERYALCSLRYAANVVSENG